MPLLIGCLGDNKMKSENKKNYIYKWYRNPDFLIVTLIGSYVICLFFIWAIFENEQKTPENVKAALPFVILAIVVVNIFLFIYAMYYGWNRPIYINSEKIWQKIKGKIYEWHWADMTDCKYVFKHIDIPPMIEIQTTTDYKKLNFKININRYKKLIQICPNEKIKTMLIRDFARLTR